MLSIHLNQSKERVHCVARLHSRQRGDGLVAGTALLFFYPYVIVSRRMQTLPIVRLLRTVSLQYWRKRTLGSVCYRTRANQQSPNQHASSQRDMDPLAVKVILSSQVCSL